jgi:hypothetical protein
MRPTSSKNWWMTVVVSRVSCSARLFIGSWHMVFAAAGGQVKGRAADQDFLTLSKDADQDTPMLIAAKSGYAKPH